MKKLNITNENTTTLKENEIFVFGSNLAGIHGAGAAKLATEKFGAEVEVLNIKENIAFELEVEIQYSGDSDSTEILTLTPVIMY